MTTTLVDMSLSMGLTAAELRLWEALSAKSARAIDRGFAKMPSKWSKASATKFADRWLATVAPHMFSAASMVNSGNTEWSSAFLTPGSNSLEPGIDVFCMHIHSRRGVTYDSLPRRMLTFSPHAMARLFQRLRTLNAEVIRKELSQGAALGLVVRNAASKLGYRQIAIPTLSGAFLCHVPDTGPLEAATWIPEAGMSERWQWVRSTLVNVLADLEERFGVPEVLMALFGFRLDDLFDWDTISAQLAAVLQHSRFHWLADVYEQRADPVGDLWKQARRQAGITH